MLLSFNFNRHLKRKKRKRLSFVGLKLSLISLTDRHELFESMIIYDLAQKKSCLMQSTNRKDIDHLIRLHNLVRAKADSLSSKWML